MQHDHSSALPACGATGPLPQAPDSLVMGSLALVLCLLVAQAWFGVA